jgi:hypothetical protein
VMNSWPKNATRSDWWRKAKTRTGTSTMPSCDQP